VKTAGAVVGRIVVGIVVLAICAVVAAGLFGALVQTGWSPRPGAIAPGLPLDVLKWGSSNFWAGIARTSIRSAKSWLSLSDARVTSAEEWPVKGTQRSRSGRALLALDRPARRFGDGHQRMG
jgi:hypothetical protein